MGLGVELLFVLFLAFLVFGPKRFQDLLISVVRAKSKFEEAGRGLRSRLTTERLVSSKYSENCEDNLPRAIESAVTSENSASTVATNE